MSFKCYAVGRLTKEPTLTITQSNIKKVSFTLASNRDYKNYSGEYEADFMRCTAWRGTAEFINNYCRKGHLVFMEGVIETGSYTDNNGRTQYTTDFKVESVKLLEKKQSEPQATNEAPTSELTSTLDLSQDDLPF